MVFLCIEVPFCSFFQDNNQLGKDILYLIVYTRLDTLLQRSIFIYIIENWLAR